MDKSHIFVRFSKGTTYSAWYACNYSFKHAPRKIVYSSSDIVDGESHKILKSRHGISGYSPDETLPQHIVLNIRQHCAGATYVENGSIAIKPFPTSTGGNILLKSRMGIDGITLDKSFVV